MSPGTDLRNGLASAAVLVALLFLFVAGLRLPVARAGWRRWCSQGLVTLGAVALTFINYRLIPDVLKTAPSKVGLDFELTDLSFGIFGFLLVIMMVLRPQGLLPERRRELELEEGVGADETLVQVRA